MKNVHVKQVYTKTDKLYSFLRVRKYTFFTNFFPGLKKNKPPMSDLPLKNANSVKWLPVANENSALPSR